jgi:hypothetical protein
MPLPLGKQKATPSSGLNPDQAACWGTHLSCRALIVWRMSG